MAEDHEPTATPDATGGDDEPQVTADRGAPADGGELDDIGDPADADAAADPDATDPRTRHRWTHAALALAAVLVVFVPSVCSGPAPSSEVVAPPPASTLAPTTTEPTTTTVPEPPPPPAENTPTTRAPRPRHVGPPGVLTGTPVERPGYERRPALIVKIDNLDPWSRPQAGLTLADVVYEEKVEGSVSRFAAIYQGSDAGVIGPVRSARSTDVSIAGPLQHPLFAYSGANGAFQAAVAGAPLIDVGAARSGAYWRGADKPMPHNLYTSTQGLYAGAAGFVPKPLWPFRGASEPPGPGARAVGAVAYQFGGGFTAVRWTWDPAEGGWVRWQNGSLHLDTDNWPVVAANVVIQYVDYVDADAQDMFGNPIPEAAMGGVGSGWVLTGGAAIPMTWIRMALEEPTFFIGPDDQQIRFAPGPTWVILVPSWLPASFG